MGLFKDLVGSTPNDQFTRARWDAVLASLDINSAVDDDGEHVADWENMRMWFGARGDQDEIMMIRAVWDVRPPLEAHDRLAVRLSQWNSDTLWPKAFVVRGEEAMIVVGDHAVDMEPGVTDDLLRQQVKRMVATSNQLFEMLAEEFPDIVAWHEQRMARLRQS